MKALFHPLSDIVETFTSISCECWRKKRYILCDFSHIFYQRTGICRHDSVFLFCMTDALQKNSSVKSCRKGQRHKKIFSGNALIIAAAVFIPPWPCRSASAARVPAKWRVHAGKKASICPRSWPVPCKSRKTTTFAHEQDLTKVPDMSRPPLMPEGTQNRVKLLKATPAPDPFLKNKKQFRQRSLSRNLLLRESRQRNPAFLRPYPGSGAPSAPCRREQHRSRREGRR